MVLGWTRLPEEHWWWCCWSKAELCPEAAAKAAEGAFVRAAFARMPADYWPNPQPFAGAAPRNAECARPVRAFPSPVAERYFRKRARRATAPARRPRRLLSVATCHGVRRNRRRGRASTPALLQPPAAKGREKECARQSPDPR